MPIYEFKNKETGDIEEHLMSFSKKEEFLKDNPKLESVMTKTPGLVSQHGSTIGHTSDGWKEVLQRTKETSGEGNTIKV